MTRPGSPHLSGIGRTRLSFAVIALIAFLGIGCATRPPPVQVGGEPALSGVREQLDRVHTLRVQFRADIYRGDDHRSANGIVLVKKPDRFRLRLTMPLGAMTVFDYVSWGDRVQQSFPMEGKVEKMPDPETDVMAEADLRRLFLRELPTDGGACVTRDDAGLDLLVLCYDGAGGLLRQAQIARGTNAVREEISFADGQPSQIVRYDDYRSVEGAYLPYQVTLRYPTRSLLVSVWVRTYEVNPELGDDLFQPPQPWDDA